MNPFLERVIAIRQEEQMATEVIRDEAPVPPVKALGIDMEKLRAEVERLGISLRQAARLCGVSWGVFGNRCLRGGPRWRIHVEASLGLPAGALITRAE